MECHSLVAKKPKVVQEIQFYPACAFGLTFTHSTGSTTTAYRLYHLLLRSYPGRRELVQFSSSLCLYSQAGPGDSIAVLWVYFNAHLGNDGETSGEGWLGGTACLISHTMSIMNTMFEYIVVHKCSSYQTLGKDWWSASSTAVIAAVCLF